MFASLPMASNFSLTHSLILWVLVVFDYLQLQINAYIHRFALLFISFNRLRNISKLWTNGLHACFGLYFHFYLFFSLALHLLTLSPTILCSHFLGRFDFLPSFPYMQNVNEETPYPVYVCACVRTYVRRYMCRSHFMCVCVYVIFKCMLDFIADQAAVAYFIFQYSVFHCQFERFSTRFLCCLTYFTYFFIFLFSFICIFACVLPQQTMREWVCVSMCVYEGACTYFGSSPPTRSLLKLK